MEFLTSGSGILLAVLGIGFVIVVHELGHFLAAKRAGVRVEMFSVGFGPVLWSRTIGETEYAISLLPLGGFVAMRERPDGSGRSFEEVSAAWRAVILCAGVAFNLAASYLLLLCLAWYGMPMIPPVIGGVEAYVYDEHGDPVPSPARELGLQIGDRIISLDGREVTNFSELTVAVINHGPEPIHLTIERNGERLRLPRSERGVPLVYDHRHGRNTLGAAPPESRRVAISAGLAGREAIEPGSLVVAIDGESTEGLIGQELDHILLGHLGREVPLILQRGDERREQVIRYAGATLDDLLSASLGLPVTVQRLMKGMPAERAGVRPGDVVLSIDSVPLSSSSHLAALVRSAGDRPVEIELLRPRYEPLADGPLLRRDGWESVVLELRPELHEASGNRLIGIEMASRNSGSMPLLPPALGSTQSPLGKAGLQADDVLLELSADPAQDDAQAAQDGVSAVGARFLRGGDTILMPLVEEHYNELLRDPPLSVWARFFRKPPAPLAVRLVGSRVASLGDEAIEVVQVRDEEEGDQRLRISLRELSPELRELLGTLQVGDWIVSLGAHGAPGFDGRGLELLRGGPQRPQSRMITPADPGVAISFKIEELPYQLESWTEAFGLAGWTTWRMVADTFQIIGRFFKPSGAGGVDASKALHGPIGIFSTLKARVEYLGFASFLKIIALLGVNLFLINLIPVPLADGGRLLFLGIEVITRRPVPERILNAINFVGLVFLICLMLWVIGNDILREMGRH